MPLASGQRLGSYEIVAPLGAGGMGEVYRAKDSKLKREVALKVLPADVANDQERLARFQREAEVLASLNHPHIAQVYGLEENALVMELIEGEDLSQRIARGPIPIDEALPIARQIAEALEAAHGAGIVHRDLKPANVKVRDDGTVKVLDFGLAKALDQGPGIGDQGSGHPANSPTITSPAMTMRGVILGTAAYMAPEQAKGKPVDKRADIWAFGCVLYEMLTGRTLFSGENTAEVIGAVLRQDVDLAALPAATPRPIRRLLRHCLERDPKQRLHDVADARIEITDALDSPEPDAAGQPVSRRARGVTWLGWGVATALAVSLGVPVLIGPDAATVPPQAYRFTIPAPDNDVGVVSPDGRHMVHAGFSGRQLQLRAFDAGEARAIDGTDGAREPFWSPDSRSIAFFAGNELKRIAVTGGPPQTLARVPQGWPAGSWSTNGTILIEVTENPEDEGWFVLSPGSASLKKIKAFGKDRAINPDKAFPWFLPDGDHFLFTHPVDNVATLQIGSINSDETRALGAADSRAMYASGFVLFVRGGTLLAQPFDEKSLAMTGEPVTLLDDVQFFSPTGEAWFSVSQTGTLVFRRRQSRSNLRWFDRGGRQTGTLLEPDHYLAATISGNGQRLALEVVDPRLSTTDIWMVDLERNVPERLTSSPRSEIAPRVSPDGSRVVFSTDWQGPPNLYVADVDDGEPRELVPFDRTQQNAGGWTPDGKQVVYTKRNESFGLDLWVVDATSGERRPILTTAFEESGPSVSPNGQWLAYESNASGRREVYVRQFPAGGWQARLSVDGGAGPVWRKDGRELFYYQPDGAIMAVQIDAGTSVRPTVSAPARLFAIDERTYRSFDVTPDGQRFLLNLVEPGGLSRPNEVIVDWMRWMRKPG